MPVFGILLEGFAKLAKLFQQSGGYDKGVGLVFSVLLYFKLRLQCCFAGGVVLFVHFIKF